MDKSGEEKQEEALLKVKILRGEVLTLYKDMEHLLQYAIKKGGIFYPGITLFRNRKTLGFFETDYPFVKTIKSEVISGVHGPYIRMYAQPLTKKKKVDKRFKPVSFRSDTIGPIWKVY